MEKITIASVKRYREQLGATQLIVFALDAEGGQHVATHGLSGAESKQAAQLGDQLKRLLQWPEPVSTEPLVRQCRNCSFYKRSKPALAMYGPSSTTDYGQCLVEPKLVERLGHDHCCRHFDPNS
jgi:hypothetical protein